jgi:hypothetical protein
MVDKQKQPKQKQAQEYDNTLKVLFGDEAAQILPRLVPGTQVHEEKNIEIDRSQLKADLVYRVKYRRRWHIVNMELQTRADKHIHYRLLQYHVGLHAKYRLPVLSVVLYPFARSVPTPPYRERGGDGVLLTWKYRVIALYTIEAEPFVREQAFCMYSMLPAMKGVTVEMLVQVLEEMKQHYTTKEMEQHLTLFWRMLQKSRTLTKEEKEQIEEVIEMEFDWWIDTNPKIKKRIARAAKASKQEGALETARQMVLDLVQARFPAQLPLAQQHITVLTKPAQLRKLMLDIVGAPDEAAVLVLLTENGPKQATRRKKQSAHQPQRSSRQA